MRGYIGNNFVSYIDRKIQGVAYEVTKDRRLMQ